MLWWFRCRGVVAEPRVFAVGYLAGLSYIRHEWLYGP